MIPAGFSVVGLAVVGLVVGLRVVGFGVVASTVSNESKFISINS